MLKKTPSTGFTPVETLTKQVTNAVSLFTTIKENLKKSQDAISAQIDLRDAEIAKLSDERQNLDELWNKSAHVIDNIEKIVS
jgi:hypothetical protein